jgi:hypothetical protein
MTKIERPNLKSYLVALLAIVYVVTWWVFGTRASAQFAAAPPHDAAPEPSGKPQLATWYHDLPPPERPVVEPPVGWHLADRPAPPTGPIARQVPVPVRVPPTRAGRIRTRSS